MYNVVTKQTVNYALKKENWMQNISAPTWDLSDLYSGLDDPRIEAAINSLIQRSESFANKYRGRIDAPDLTATTLLSAIKDYEGILQDTDKPLTYASLLFATDTSKPEYGAFMQKMQERSTEISILLVFFDLELMSVPEEQMSQIVADPLLAEYRHYIWAARLFRDHRLSEPEEKILEEKANTGRRAFSRLFEETVSNIQFHITRDGSTETLTLPEVIAFLREPDRELRKAGAASLTAGLVENARALTFIFNTLIQDKATDDRLRKYSYPEESRNLSNELDTEIVELVVSTAIDNYPMVAKYYDLKRQILGYDKLTHYDRYAPLFETKETVPFDKAREIILSAFGKFNPILANTADKFFEKSWIDAEPRKGKRGGAFCAFVTPDLHPYIFTNYLNRMDDVMTLGHEMGHGVHSYLARDESYMNFAPVLPVAELASTFGEMLVFEVLQSEASRDDKLALYAEKIEGAFATIFRQAAMYRFEQAIHTQRRETGELTTEQFSALWQKLQQQMFGSSVELGDEHRFWWMYVSHFIGSPFYVYAYTFGELLVMALYAMYKKEGEAFSAKYIELLKVGGSMTPAEMLGRVGIDIRDRAFWQGGMQVLQGFINDFESLCRE